MCVVEREREREGRERGREGERERGREGERERGREERERESVCVCVCVCVSAEELQANITAQQRSVELLELQETLSWPPLASLCPDSYIPQVSHQSNQPLPLYVHCTCPQGLSLDQQPCRDRLATPSRQLLHNGLLHLIDNRGRRGNDIHLFLFTDMLLLTDPHNKSARKESNRVWYPRHTVQVCIFVCVCS